MDLKLKDVAELLNISETTVRRLLTDGKIPAYRINRQYRFNRSEIEKWVMEQKLFGQKLCSNEKETKDELSSLKAGNMQFSLYRAIYRGGVLSKIAYKTKEETIRHTMDYMTTHFGLDADVLTDLFLDRENLMTTGLGHGLAVPHTRDFLLNTHYDVIITVFPDIPIEYGSLDGEPVHTLFFLFASDDKKHLHLLAKIAHLTSQESSRAFLQTKPSKENLLDFIKNWESSLKIYSSI